MHSRAPQRDNGTTGKMKLSTPILRYNRGMWKFKKTKSRDRGQKLKPTSIPGSNDNDGERLSRMINCDEYDAGENYGYDAGDDGEKKARTKKNPTG
jgi:hypothetical protein